MLGYTDDYFHATRSCQTSSLLLCNSHNDTFLHIGWQNPTPVPLPAGRHLTYRHPNQRQTPAACISNYRQENVFSKLEIKTITSHQPLDNPSQWNHLSRKMLHTRTIYQPSTKPGTLFSLSTTENVSFPGVEPMHIPTSSLTINNTTNRYNIKSKTKIKW